MSKPKSTVVMDLPADAIREAKQLVSQLKLGEKVGSEIREYEEFFTGKAYESYMNELFAQLDRLAMEKDSSGIQTAGKKVGSVKKSNNSWYDKVERTWIVPISFSRPTNRGLTMRFSAGELKETSNERAVEIYTDTSAGVEASLGIDKGPITFKVVAGEKVGTRLSSKTAAKETSRQLTAVERSLEIISVERDVIEIEWETAKSIEIVPWNLDWSASDWTLKRVINSIQLGYQLRVNPGGQTIGHFWPDYETHEMTSAQLRRSALLKVGREIQSQQKQFAEDLLLM